MNKALAVFFAAFGITLCNAQVALADIAFPEDRYTNEPSMNLTLPILIAAVVAIAIVTAVFLLRYRSR